MFTVQAEPVQILIDECLAGVFEEHWEDLALNQDRVPLDPQFHVYREREEKNELSCMVMRDDAGELVGYFICFIGPGLHYQTCLTATMDIFYVRPRFRDNLLAGRTLLRAVEKDLRSRGVDRWFVGTKLHKDIGRLFEALKFQPVEMYYAKWLGD